MLFFQPLYSITEKAIDLTVGNIFQIQVHYKPDKFKFVVHIDGEIFMSYIIPTDIQDIEFAIIRLQGDFHVDYIGYLEPGKYSLNENTLPD